jgi:hypothetical protein
LWLLDVCADPGKFRDLNEAVAWLSEEDNSVLDDFLNIIFAKGCWAPQDMVAELCLRLANQLAWEERGDQ